jgi:hypothetical protein
MTIDLLSHCRRNGFEREQVPAASSVTDVLAMRTMLTQKPALRKIGRAGRGMKAQSSFTSSNHLIATALAFWFEL